MTTRPAERELHRTGEPEALEAELSRTREELGKTIDALSHKLDVKSRTRSRLARTSNQAKTQLARHTRQAQGKLAHELGRARANPAPVSGVVVAATACVALGVVLWSRRS